MSVEKLKNLAFSFSFLVWGPCPTWKVWRPVSLYEGMHMSQQRGIQGFVTVNRYVGVPKSGYVCEKTQKVALFWFFSVEICVLLGRYEDLCPFKKVCILSWLRGMYGFCPYKKVCECLDIEVCKPCVPVKRYACVLIKMYGWINQIFWIFRISDFSRSSLCPINEVCKVGVSFRRYIFCPDRVVCNAFVTIERYVSVWIKRYVRFFVPI